MGPEKRQFGRELGLNILRKHTAQEKPLGTWDTRASANTPDDAGARPEPPDSP